MATKKKVTKWIKKTLTKEQIEEFKKEEKEAEDSDDLICVAHEIIDAGDQEWAKKVFKKAVDKAESFYDFRRLADAAIHSNRWIQGKPTLLSPSVSELGDKEWAKKVYKKAEGKAETSDHFKDLADSIEEKLEDNEWAKKLYEKALELVDDEEYDEEDIAELKEKIEELG